ncbi:hypothetical protein QTP70_029815 [Hemibagrus guttatus]|uniref:Secreted protein n=1 Tax=Hemibagrus guttatus TaxID=175788 RepID=A0AAE0R0M9_9TELE|nr:hypothetical protein QTP70_029815 [Hemibagrus guttatus]
MVLWRFLLKLLSMCCSTGLGGGALRWAVSCCPAAHSSVMSLYQKISGLCDQLLEFWVKVSPPLLSQRLSYTALNFTLLSSDRMGWAITLSWGDWAWL